MIYSFKNTERQSLFRSGLILFKIPHANPHTLYILHHLLDFVNNGCYNISMNTKYMPEEKNRFSEAVNYVCSILESAGCSSASILDISDCIIDRSYLMPEHASHALIFTVPYLSKAAQYTKGNLSVYAAPRDYHIFFSELFKNIKSKTEKIFPEFSINGFSDHSPINEVNAAVRAGLGILGDNHLLITPDYGSYVFIGEIFFSADEEKYRKISRSITDTTSENGKKSTMISGCLHCGKCIKACPSPNECLSAVTQKKGNLTETEVKMISTTGTVWGCDVCQKVCPMNQGIKLSEIPFFSEKLSFNITYSELENMSEPDFSERAYAWRGKNTIERNLKITDKKN